MVGSGASPAPTRQPVQARQPARSALAHVRVHRRVQRGTRDGATCAPHAATRALAASSAYNAQPARARVGRGGSAAGAAAAAASPRLSPPPPPGWAAPPGARAARGVAHAPPGAVLYLASSRSPSAFSASAASACRRSLRARPPGTPSGTARPASSSRAAPFPPTPAGPAARRWLPASAPALARARAAPARRRANRLRVDLANGRRRRCSGPGPRRLSRRRRGNRGRVGTPPEGTPGMERRWVRTPHTGIPPPGTPRPGQRRRAGSGPLIPGRGRDATRAPREAGPSWGGGAAPGPGARRALAVAEYAGEPGERRGERGGARPRPEADLAPFPSARTNRRAGRSAGRYRPRRGGRCGALPRSSADDPRAVG